MEEHHTLTLSRKKVLAAIQVVVLWRMVVTVVIVVSGVGSARNTRVPSSPDSRGTRDLMGLGGWGSKMTDRRLLCAIH